MPAKTSKPRTAIRASEGSGDRTTRIVQPTAASVSTVQTELREKFISIMDSMSVMFILLDRALIIRYVSNAANDLRASLSIGHPFHQDIKLGQERLALYHAVFETGKGFTQLNYKPSDERLPRCNLRVIPVGDEIAVCFEDAEALEERELRIRSSEERFRTLSGNLSLALVLIDRDRKVTYWNQMAEVTSGGISEADAVGKDAYEVLPFKETSLITLLERARAGEQNIRVVISPERKGVRGTYAVHAFQVGEESALLIEDITQQVEQSAELARTNQNLFDLYNNAPCGYFSILPNGNIAQMSRRMAEWLGYDSSEPFVGNPLSNLLADASREAFESELSSSGLESPLNNLELEFVKHDGEILRGLINALPIYGEIENHWYWRRTVVDITELRLAQNQIEDSRLFHELFNELGEGVLISDKEGRIVRANKSAIRILGIPIERLTELRQDSDIWQTVSEDGTPIPIKELPAVTALREKRAVTNRELGVMRPDGLLTWILISAAPLFDKVGNVTGVILTFPEVTSTVTQRQALKDLNDTLAVERDRANEANRLKSSFLANMSHEIRTPMTAILGFTDILSAELAGKVSEQHSTFLKSINVSGKRLLNLINDILDISKIEAGRLELQSEAIDIKGEIELSASPLLFMAKQKALDLRFELPLERVFIRADRQRLGQVLTNIISNAVKFTREGSIVVRAEVNASGEVAISIRDSGIGISEEFLPHLFEEFRQEHTGITREFGGTGLGLAISRRLVSLMGGKIEVTSKEGVGTVFTLIFPKYSTSGNVPIAYAQVMRTPLPPAELKKAPKTSNESSAARKTVLIVEDNIETQRLLDVYIKQQYEVLRAMNAEEALEVFHRDHPDAILMDVNLPGKDGLWITQEIRKGSVNPRTPIVALTAFAMIGDRERCIKAGCNQYLSKPVTKREVLEVLESMLTEAGNT